MITQIKLTNFKCFKEETTFPLSNFNLLTGINGGGKSTLLQSLLLMRQSIEHDMYTTQLILNGSCVNLGCFDDVRNREVSASEPIFFEFTLFNNPLHYRLNPKNDDSMSLHISDICENDYYNYCYDSYTKLYQSKYKEELFYRLVKLEPPSNPSVSIENNIFTIDEIMEECYGPPPSEHSYFERIHFISADRIGPQDFYKKATLPNFPHVGTRGEFTINLLDKMRERVVDESLCLGNDAKTLLTQTEAWLGKILNPLKVEVPYSKTNFLELLIGGYKPANVGFGYSSVLPIIVSGLIADVGEQLIVENPEIHLHPKAQSALIQFLVAVAKTGVQVFVESHSDHVLNALRIATKEKLLEPQELVTLYFKRNEISKLGEVVNIVIDEKGKLHQKTKEGLTAKIPKGFFDEWTNSMAKLF